MILPVPGTPDSTLLTPLYAHTRVEVWKFVDHYPGTVTSTRYPVVLVPGYVGGNSYPGYRGTGYPYPGTEAISLTAEPRLYYIP
eukprot:2595583-Rhodomonas_salina.1